VSLNDWGITQEAFVGFDNYVEILSLDLAPGGAALQAGYTELFRIGDLVIGARDVLFWRSLRNIALFTVLAVPLAVVPALLIATLLNSKAPGIRVFRALYFVPTVAGVVGVTLIWKQLFNSTVGFVNYLILRASQLLSALPGVDIVAPQPQWLSDADIAIFSLVIVFAWQYLGYNTILFLAGLQAVPADLYEAAHLDGANRWQRFRNITLPMLAPTTFFVVAVTSILALQLFTESVVLFSNFTPPGSGPNNAALTPVAYLYQEGFQRFSQGYASAVAWVLFVLIFAFTFVQFRRQRAQAEGV
jgi:ABC-type sugar transport system permease subunit